MTKKQTPKKGKSKVGRPPKYKTPEDMQKVIDEYFESVTYINPDTVKTYCQPTMTGLAIALDMSRQALCGYKEKTEFLDTIKKARARVEESLERHLYGNSVTGAIFNLKNNFGWRDKQEIEQHNTHKLDMSDMTDEELERIAKG